MEGEQEKTFMFTQLYDEVDRECKSKSIKKMDMKEFLNCMEELQYYSIIEVDRNKKEVKNSKFNLNVDLDELTRELA